MKFQMFFNNVETSVSANYVFRLKDIVKMFFFVGYTSMRNANTIESSSVKSIKKDQYPQNVLLLYSLGFRLFDVVFYGFNCILWPKLYNLSDM